jgi:poly-beta-1,6-N-acetyl-D-glucosamine synthase
MQWLPVILMIPYTVLLLKIHRSLLKIKPFFVTNDPVTFVSVVVACRNEEKNLPHLLKCFAEQNYPAELFEVIIVDDNSSDNTYDLSAAYRMSGNLRTIKNTGSGKKQALRSGVGISSGKLIITTDADCRMDRNWIRTIAAFYEKSNPDMIICPVRLEKHPGFFGWFQELEFLSLQGITAGSAYQNNGTMCNGANLAFTRDTYLNNTGDLHFEIATGDDVFLLHSLKKHSGSKILWLESQNAIVKTKASDTTVSFFDQRKRWISKINVYRDSYSIILGIITFLAIILQAGLMVAGIIDHTFLPVLLTVFILKSIPDYLILQNTTSRYGSAGLMGWFLPAQIIYPFYVLGVVFYALIFPGTGKINYPFRKET